MTSVTKKRRFPYHKGLLKDVCSEGSQVIKKAPTMVIPSAEEYGVAIDDINRKIFLPKEAALAYGCINCEWKEFDMCPLGFKTGRGCDLKKNRHVSGICNKRKVYLSAISGTSKEPTFAEWLEGYNSQKTQNEINRNITELMVLREKLYDAKESGLDDKEIKDIERQIAKKRYEWTNLTNSQRTFTSKQIDRETPRDVNVNINDDRISLQQVNDIRRKNRIVDAEYKEKEEVKDEKQE